ncbi:hypothetical protein SAMN05443575_1031 [Jatrophihabitans endophyticus]|uniref:Uncharacterized protein n=1 Tax=Jatrophihabitans endophyticus TaxID=1206085 RepID=A0A1M5EWW6_9ACTN|nr:hypothetical protein [Jatrophihabitans endophyticus]SHF83687.1 hypothetical protein SAMN05443575_1031 [Jatrophihabitans endophyticus]
MRVYLPATTTMLQELVDTGAIGTDATPLTAFAVTPALREWYVDDDEEEELEYAALSEAARGSLRLVDADDTAARRRVVVAVDAPDAGVEIRDDLDRGVVQLADPVVTAAVASVHVDDDDAEPTVTAAAEAIIAADLGDAGSQERVDDAEGFELSWYANQEIPALLATL